MAEEVMISEKSPNQASEMSNIPVILLGHNEVSFDNIRNFANHYCFVIVFRISSSLDSPQKKIVRNRTKLESFAPKTCLMKMESD